MPNAINGAILSKQTKSSASTLFEIFIQKGILYASFNENPFGIFTYSLNLSPIINQ